MIQTDKLTTRVRMRESSFVNVGSYTSHLYVLIAVDNHDCSLFFLFSHIYMCFLTYININIYIYSYICMRVFFPFYSSLSLSRFLWTESFIGKQDSPVNGRLIKQNFIILVTVIEKEPYI
jgi:hypothetical protein